MVSSSATGVGGATIAGLSVDGTTYTDAPGGLVDWSFSNPDYASQNGEATVTISQVGSTVTVTPAASSVTYDAEQHGATAAWASSGTDGAGGSLTVTYVGIDGTDYASSTTAPTDVGEYQASASFAGNTDHTGSSNTADFAITPATATITVTGFSGGYDGEPHGVASSSATGVGGATIAGLSVDGTTYTDAPGGLVDWSFSNPDYASQNGEVTVTINPAVINYRIADDIQTQGTPADLASDLGTTIAGVNGETLDIAYSSIGDTTAADVGNYDITGVVSNGTGLVSNYTVNLTDGTLTVEPVGELPTPVVTVADVGGTYSSLAFQATGTVTGISERQPRRADVQLLLGHVRDSRGPGRSSGLIRSTGQRRRLHGSRLLRRRPGLHSG